MINYNYRSILYKNYFSKNGEKKGYILSSHNQRSYYEEYFLRKFLPMKKDISILDIGCGEGSILFSLLNLGYENLTGVDISQEAVDSLAQTELVSKVIQSELITFLNKSIEEGKKWDFILAIDVLEHFTKDELKSYRL